MLVKSKTLSIKYLLQAKTLVRDYKKLAENYEIISLKAYDMFPFTKHVECVALLNKRKNVIKEE